MSSSTVSLSPGSGMQQIDLSKLTVPQLAQLKQQLDQEIGVIQDSLQTLKMAQGKFHESEQSLDRVIPDTKSHELQTILVPLTGSMYVPGVIADNENVLIDIGTGYYIQKDIEDGKDYFKRKVKYITEQMDKIQSVGREKANIQDVICQLIGSKIQAQKATTS